MIHPIIIFLSGMVSGVTLFIACAVYHWKKIQKTKARLMSQLKSKMKDSGDKMSSLKDRLIKAADLAQQQIALKAQGKRTRNSSCTVNSL